MSTTTRNTIRSYVGFILLSFAWLFPLDGQIQFKIELMPDAKTYQVKLKSEATYTGAGALTSTAQVTLIAPNGTFFIHNLTSVHGIWENNTNVSAPEENPGFDYFLVGLISLGTAEIPYSAGEEVVLFTFENLYPCTASIELMEQGDPFTPPNTQSINAGNEVFVLGFGNGNAWTGNYDQGSTACSTCNKPIEYSIRLLEDGQTYQVSLRSTTDYFGIDQLTNSAQVSLVVPTGTFQISNLQSINGHWAHNTLIRSPQENPEFDYFLIGLTTNGTMDITYQAGAEIPLFTFENSGLCAGPISLMEAGDPFYPPNSQSINAGNEIVLFGFGNQNAWCGNYGLPANCHTLTLQAKAFLQGPFVAEEKQMHDSLRQRKYIPLQEPYSTLIPAGGQFPAFTHIQGGGEKIEPIVLEVTGDNAIVDWVFLELRDAADVMQTVSTRSALLQRDGDIVDIDGRSPVAFSGVSPGSYHVSIRHRNHLGIMSDQAITFGKDPAQLDFTAGPTPVYGTYARAQQGEHYLMWAGDNNSNGWIGFSGKGNDVDALFLELLSSPENPDRQIDYTARGYLQCDIDLNGAAVFKGPSDDIDLIMLNVMQHPANEDKFLNFILMCPLP